ncbi:MAG: hypothetical protein F6K14_28410 [Symploca sp. SIO2C1]|nr:hypothetical protein [Symploca sp. SIO2C1]
MSAIADVFGNLEVSDRKQVRAMAAREVSDRFLSRKLAIEVLTNNLLTPTYHMIELHQICPRVPH